jgi:hypothetical protein
MKMLKSKVASFGMTNVIISRSVRTSYIIKNRLLKDYHKSPIFEDEVALPYPDEMKIEMLCGNPLQGYLLEQRPLSIKVNYIGDSFKVPINNYKKVKGFKQKMCRMYGLGKDVVVTDEENRFNDQDMILEYCPEEVWLCVNN